MTEVYEWIFFSKAWLDASFLANPLFENMKRHYSGKCFTLMPKCPFAKLSFIQGVSRWPLRLKNDVTHHFWVTSWCGLFSTVKRTAHLNFRRKLNSDKPINDRRGATAHKAYNGQISMSQACGPSPLCSTIALLCLFLSHGSIILIR